MKNRRLGRTGLKVSEICLGTMTFGHQCDERTSFAIMDRAAERGVNFLDTADVYPVPPAPETAGRTEEIVGAWLHGRRDRFVLATKCRMRVGHGPNDEGLSRRHVMKAVEDSLRRLRTDYIDLYQSHSPDPETPPEETLRAFDDLVRQGKVRYVGCSNYPAWQVALALGFSERLGLARFDCVQPRYNLLYREIEAELLPLCRDQGVGVIAYNPLAGGFLSGKYRSLDEPPPGTRFTLGKTGDLYRERYWQQAQLEAVEHLRRHFEKRGKALATVAIAWVLPPPSSAPAGPSSSTPPWPPPTSTWTARTARCATSPGTACPAGSQPLAAKRPGPEGRSRMSPRRPAPLPPVTADDLLAALRAVRLLPAARLRHLAEAWGGAGGAAARARELVEAGLLTAFQAERVLAGRARALRLGKYRLLDRLGAGGMGRVYKAEHRLMRRVVALKVIGRARHPARAAARFRREAKAAAALSHPNIVTAYDAATARGLLFLVMEHVEGVDLERLVAAAGPLPVPLACEVARQTARALHYAHERGLVHHDVKPANLLLAQPGTVTPAPDGYDPAGGAVVKLLDLGLARRAAAGGSAAGAEAVEGTPDYMAPERGHGRPADVRSDLYSLRCTLYFLLTGQVPFPGGGWPEKLLRHQLEAPVPVRSLRPEVPPAVAAVVERLMAPDPAQRYPTPAALLAALGPAAVSAPGATRRRRERPSAWLALAAVLSGTLIGWVMRAALSRPVPLPHKPPLRAAAAVKSVTFTVEGRPGRFDTLAAAVAAAQSGDTVVLHGPGRVAAPPLAWAGKALTLRAAPGGRPVLELTAPEHPWQALLCADSELTLEGLELRHALPREAGPLVCVEGAALRLRDCVLYSAGGGPLVVCRGGPGLTLRGCRLDAGAVGASAEVGAGPCRVTLEGNTVTVREPSGVALSLWAAELTAPAAAAVRLAENACSAGRVAAFRGLAGPLTLTAEGNHFRFREAVLSFDHYAPEEWRRTTTWRGRDNRFDGPGAWLRVEGLPVGVRDLAGWQRLWDEPSPGGSVEVGGRVQAAPRP
jgi:1-deoxyxylulose-5-phosphate synthase